MRIGHGYDVHKFAENRKLIIGGTEKGADSILLLKEVCRVLADYNYRIVNIDSTVIAQQPKLKPHIDEMRKNIANACGIDISLVSVKATTEEKLGFTGRLEGISAHAVCLIEQY